VKKTSDRDPNRFDVFLDLLIAKAKDVPAVLTNVGLSFKIFFGDMIVVATINFDNQLIADTSKICEVRSDRMFASKLQGT
jgi:hypothetical protein